MTPTDRYSLVVIRQEKEYVPVPTYKTFIYRMIDGGVCGPFTEKATARGMANVLILADVWGFQLAGPPELSMDATSGNAACEYPLAPKP
jgi:hypothetical protein